MGGGYWKDMLDILCPLHHEMVYLDQYSYKGRNGLCLLYQGFVHLGDTLQQSFRYSDLIHYIQELNNIHLLESYTVVYIIGHNQYEVLNMFDLYGMSYNRGQVDGLHTIDIYYLNSISKLTGLLYSYMCPGLFHPYKNNPYNLDCLHRNYQYTNINRVPPLYMYH